MLAVKERIADHGPGRDRFIWHKPVGNDLDFQRIACSDEDVIALSSGKRQVPLNLDVPGEEWCPDCLALARRKPTA